MPAEVRIRSPGKYAWIPAFAGVTIKVFLALAMCLADARAQDWPTRPVRWILTQPSGASVDITARLIAERLTRSWGRQIVVDNRPGGQSVIGAQAAARAAPDGYNFLFATTAPIVINPFTFKSLPYDPAKDFVPVAMVGSTPFVIAASPGVGPKSFAELIALARSQPGRMALADQGPRSLGGMISQVLGVAASVRFLHVPYNVQGIAIQDAIAGRMQAVVLSTGILTPFLKRGDLCPLAVTGRKRIPGLEQVPAISESFPGFDYDGWYALLAPAGTPAAVVKRVNRDVDAVLTDPEVVQRLRELGIFTASAGTPEALAKLLAAERQRWSKVAREIGLEPE